MNTPCGCPTNSAGDICCHKCGQRVSKRCWNCGTPRGEGPCPSVKPCPDGCGHDQPLLGLATTRQLLEELRARGEVTAPLVYGYHMKLTASAMLDSLPASVLDYRTVDGE